MPQRLTRYIKLVCKIKSILSSHESARGRSGCGGRSLLTPSSNNSVRILPG